MFDSQIAYVIKCNQRDNRYLGFNNNINKKDPNRDLVYVRQTESDRLDQALYFETKEDAEKAKQIYIESNVMEPHNVSYINIEEVTIYKKDNYVKTTTKLGFTAYMQLDAFNEFIYN